MHQNSNIVEFVGLLKKDDPSKQMVYYHVCHTYHSKLKPSDHYFAQSGIGTFTSPQYSNSPIASNISEVNEFLQLIVDDAKCWQFLKWSAPGRCVCLESQDAHYGYVSAFEIIRVNNLIFGQMGINFWCRIVRQFLILNIWGLLNESLVRPSFGQNMYLR